MKFRLKSIKSRLTLLLLTIAVMGFGPYETYNYIQTKQRLHDELEISADRQIRRLKESLIIPLWEMDDRWIDKLINIDMLNDDTYAIQVSGDEQLWVARVRNDEWQAIPGNRQPIDGNFVFREGSVKQDDVEIGRIKLYLSKKRLDEQLQEARLVTTIRGLTLIFLIVFCLRLALELIVVKPLLQLLDVVKRIAAGNYNVTFNQRLHDELGLLARGILQMMQNLHLRKTERDIVTAELQQTNKKLAHELHEHAKAQIALKELNETLELRIDERTKDLNRSNQSLREISLAFEKAKNDAESANKAKSIFLANMTHELRTPMNAVLGFSRLMQSDSDLTATQRENLDIINRSGTYLLELINQVLDMAKIESGRMIVENAPFDLGSVIRNIIDMMQERAKSKGLQLRIDQCSIFPRFIDADTAKFRHILVNLLSNAIKYTKQGEITLRLNAHHQIDRDGLMLVCEVEDTGIGIAAEDIPHIFAPFVQLGSLSDQQGTGLGLVITKQYVELMEGVISVHSQPGKGSLFRVEIPVGDVAESTIEDFHDSINSRVIGLEPGQPDYKILVVEDKAENRLLLKKILESVGFNVMEATNGQEGVEAFKQWHPDFIWMDRRMPVMDGIEATKIILTLPEADKVKIAAVTASVYLEERQAFFNAGACDIVNKPYRNEEIFDCMAKHLGVRFLYAEDEDLNTPSDETMRENVLDRLKQQPSKWLKSFELSAIELDVEGCLELVKSIGADDSVSAEQLSAMINHFEFDLILQLLSTVQQTMKES